MILVILVGMVGLWLAGNWQPVGWTLVAVACLLWLPYALAAGQPSFALAVATFAAVSLRNHRKAQGRPIWPRRRLRVERRR
jgi:hypothetical protein